MKKTYYIILILLLPMVISGCSTGSDSGNSTEVGFFWYNGSECDTDCDMKYDMYKNVFPYEDGYVIHIVLLRSMDKVIYHYGSAVVKNDSLKLHIEEKYFTKPDHETKRSMCLNPINFYFSTRELPKTITIQLDNYRPLPLDTLELHKR